MKKILGILSIMLACTFLFACSNGNQAQVKLASKKISGGLDKMISQVKKLEDVNSDKMDLNSLLGEDVDTSEGYNCYGNDCYYCENGNCYKCKNCPQNNGYSGDVSTSRRNVKRNIYPYREILAAKVPTRNRMSQRANVNLFAGGDYRSAKRNLNLSNNGNGNYNELRTACNNVCDLNKEYSTTKTSLINNCNIAKQLLERFKNGEAKLSDSDVKTLNSYYEVIKQCTNNISSCKSCKSTVNSIGKKKLNLASNSGSMTADYRNIYNCLDANCNACNNANNSVLDLIDFANKLLGEKQDAAMLGTSTGSTRYNATKNKFNSNRYQQSNSVANNRNNSVQNANNIKQSNNKNIADNYLDGSTYNTNPYTKDIKDPQKYYENRRHNPNIINGEATTLLPMEYEKPVANDTTGTSAQNDAGNATSNNSHLSGTIVSNRLPSNASQSPATNSSNNSNQSVGNKQYGVTYNKNGNSISNNFSTTYHPNALPQSTSGTNNQNGINKSGDSAYSNSRNNSNKNSYQSYPRTTSSNNSNGSYNTANSSAKNNSNSRYKNSNSNSSSSAQNNSNNYQNNTYGNQMPNNTSNNAPRYSNNTYKNNSAQNNSSSTYANNQTKANNNYIGKQNNSDNSYKADRTQSNTSRTNNINNQNYSNSAYRNNSTQRYYNNQGNSPTYGADTNFSSSRNNPRVNYYASAALRAKTEMHMENFTEPFAPHECIKSLSYGPKQVRA